MGQWIVVVVVFVGVFVVFVCVVEEVWVFDLWIVMD